MTFTPPHPDDYLLAPFSQDAEESTLGCVLTSGLIAYDEIATFLNADDFYLKRHTHIWESFARLRKDKMILDMTTICEDLRERGLLQDIGGPAYIIQLVNSTPNSMHGESYARLVKRASTRRKLLVSSDKIRDIAMNENLHIDTVLAQAEAAVFDAGRGHAEKQGEWIDTSADRVWNAMMQVYSGESSPTAISTGFQNIDGILGGMDLENLIVLAGRPGMGKTALLLCIIMELAKRGIPVSVFTMEMSTDQLTSRMFGLLSGVNANKMRVKGALSKEEAQLLAKARDEFKRLPIHIFDEPSPTPRAIMRVAQRMVRSEGAQAVFVDGIYRMSADYDTKGDDTKAYSQIAMALKTMARSLSVPVVATHQLNRDLEKRPDKRPILADLRQSGRIEEEADIVAFLYRDVVYNPSADEHDSEFIVAKNRHGGVGKTPLYFEKTLTKFVDGIRS